MSATYHDLLLDARRRLEKADVSGAQLEARLIVCRACGKSRDELVRDSQLFATSEREAAVEALMQRRLSGEPLAYILGEWEFMGRTLEVTHDTLIPRADTEVLCEQAIALLPKGGRLLDVCCGTGCIGLCAAAETVKTTVTLVDLSPQAVAVTKRNARRLGLGTRAMVLSADALKPLPATLGKFDVIVSNPPYIPHGDMASLDRSVHDFEPHMALDGGVDGLDFYRAFAANLKEHLDPGGHALFEVGIGEAPTVAELFASAGWRVEEVINDLAGVQRVVKCALD